MRRQGKRATALDHAIGCARVDAEEQHRPMVVRYSIARSVIIGPSRGTDPALVICTVYPDGRVEHELVP